MTELFALVATLGLDASKFTSGLSTAWGAVSNFIKDVYGAGLAFDRAMGDIAGVRRLDATSDEMQDLRSHILDLAPASKFTAAEIAGAALEMSKLGWTTDEIKGGLKSVIDLSAASGEDLARTAYIVSSGMAQFGVAASDAEDYVNVLAVTAANSGTDIRMIGDSMKYAGPIAAALGYDFRDVAEGIGLMANQGTRGSMAGTSMRNVMVRLATNLGETEKKMGALSILTQELGVDFYDSTGKARPWGEVITEARNAWSDLSADMSPELIEQIGSAFGFATDNTVDANEVLTSFKTELDEVKQLWHEYTSNNDVNAQKTLFEQYEGAFQEIGIRTREANGEMRDMNELITEAQSHIGGLTDEQKISYAHTIGSMRGMVGWIEIMESGAEKTDQLHESIQNADGAVEDMANKRLDQFGGDIDMLASRWDALKVALYDNTKDDARTVVSELTTSVDNITDAVNEAGGSGGDALIAGIEQAGKEVDRLLTILEPVFAAVAGRLGTILSSSIMTAISTLSSSSSTLWGLTAEIGTHLGMGLFNGLMHGLAANSSERTKDLVWTFLGIDLDKYLDTGGGTFGASASFGGEGFGGATGGGGSVEQFAGAVREKVGNATEEGITQGASAGFGAVIAGGGSAELGAGASRSILKQEVESGITDGAEQAFTNSNVNAEVWAHMLGQDAENALSDAGTSGGVKLGGHLFNKLKLKTPEMQAEVEQKIGSAGTSAGNDLVSGIQGILSAATFGVNIFASIFGHGQGYAKAMNTGYLLNGATVFGFSRKGDPLIGGEAGQEAVIGTRALTSMITEAVAAGGAGAGNVSINVYQQPGESADALADKIQRILVRRERQRRSSLT